MKRSEGSTAAVVLVGCSAGAAMVLFRGFSPVMLALLPVITATALSIRTWPGRMALLLLLLSFASENALPWAVLVAGGLFCFSGTGPAVRGLGFASISVAVWTNPILNALPLLIAAAAAVFLHRNPRAAFILLPAGVIVSAFLTGLPVAPFGHTHIARSFIENDSITWSIPDLNSHRTEIRLPAPCSGQWAMWIILDGGGLRDTMPMAAVELNEHVLSLPAGRDTLSFTMLPGDTLTVSMLRPGRPFTHPVVHLQAGGELL